MIFMPYFLNNILFWFLENIIITSLIKKQYIAKLVRVIVRLTILVNKRWLKQQLH